MANALQSDDAKVTLLQKIPVSIFGIIMGISGLSNAFRLAEHLFRLNYYFGSISGLMACGLLFLLLLVFLLKFMLFPVMVLDDFNHPLNSSFYGTIPISILLVSTIVHQFSVIGYQILWCLGTLLIFVLAYISFYRLLGGGKQRREITPILILPVVGVLNVAVTSGKIPWFWAHDVSLLSLAVGGILAIVFFTLIFSEIIYGQALSLALKPSLMILMSPFAVGFLAYINISAHVDLFSTLLYYFASFLFSIFFIKIFNHQYKFIHTWWSVSFPMAALTNCSLVCAINDHRIFSITISAILLITLGVLISYMFFQTIIKFFNNTLFSASE
ncbi:tellurite resistance protein [Pedobacter sp. UYP24]